MAVSPCEADYTDATDASSDGDDAKGDPDGRRGLLLRLYMLRAVSALLSGLGNALVPVLSSDAASCCMIKELLLLSTAACPLKPCFRPEEVAQAQLVASRFLNAAVALPVEVGEGLEPTEANDSELEEPIEEEEEPPPKPVPVRRPSPAKATLHRPPRSARPPKVSNEPKPWRHPDRLMATDDIGKRSKAVRTAPRPRLHPIVQRIADMGFR